MARAPSTQVEDLLPIAGQGKRIQQLVLDLTARLNRRVTLAEFGDMVGRAEKGRSKPYSATGVSEWIQERNEPSIAAFQAMAKLSGRSFLWVTLGEEEKERLPILPAVPAQTEGETASLKKPSRRRRRA
jgi:hypothetical protein